MKSQGRIKSRNVGQGSFGVVIDPYIPCPGFRRDGSSATTTMPLIGKLSFHDTDTRAAQQTQKWREGVDPGDQSTVRMVGRCVLGIDNDILPLVDDKTRQSIQRHVHNRSSLIQYIYPFINGGDLHDYLASPPPRQTLLSILVAILPIFETLGRMYRDGWSHLDIKPENILVAKDPRTDHVQRLFLNDWDYRSSPRTFHKVNKNPSGRRHLTVDYMPPQYFQRTIRLDPEVRRTAISKRSRILFYLGYTPEEVLGTIRAEFGEDGFYPNGVVTRVDARALSTMDVYSMGLVLLDILVCPSFSPIPDRSSSYLSVPNDNEALSGIVRLAYPTTIVDQSMLRTLERAFQKGSVPRLVRRLSAAKQTRQRSAEWVVMYQALVLTDAMLRLDPSDRPPIEKVVRTLSKITGRGPPSGIGR